MTEAGPMLTIGMPLYNGEEYVAAAIESILGQDYTDFELVISDNASKDASLEIALGYQRVDSRVRVHSSPENRGAAWNFNEVLRLAEGRYFKWAGHDDLLLPGHLSASMGAVEDSPQGNILWYTRSYLIRDDETERREWEDRMHLQQDSPADRLDHYLRNVNLVNYVFGVWDIEALRASSGLGSYASADLVLLAELAIAGKFFEVPDRLFLRRVEETASHRASGRYEGFAAWFDPANQSRLVFPVSRVLRELLRAVGSSGASPAEKRTMRKSVLQYAIRKKGALAREIARAPSVMVRTARGQVSK